MWFKRTQAEVLEFMHVIGWVDASSYTEKIIQITNLNKSDLTYDDMQFACGMKIQVGLRVRDFSERQWRNQYFRYAVSCLDSKSSEIWEKVNSYN